MKRNIFRKTIIAGALSTVLIVPSFFYAASTQNLSDQVLENKVISYDVTDSRMMESSQEEIEQVAKHFIPKGAEITMPQESEQTDKFISVDLNKNGIDELAVFYKTQSDIGMLLLEWTDAKWNLKDRVIGYGNTLNYAAFWDLNGDEVLELIIGGEGHEKDKKLSVYKLEDERYKEFAKLDYDRFSIGELEEDGTLEIASLIKTDKEISSVKLQVYNFDDYSYELEYETEFQYGEYPDAVTIGRVNKNQQGIFVDMGLGAHSALTEIVVKEDGKYKNVLKHNNEYDFSQTFKPYPLYSMDINNDGIIEVGIQTAPPETDHLPMAGVPWINNWYQWDGKEELISEPVMVEYSNYSEGYRFIIPASWRGKITIDQKRDAQYRVQSVHFIYLGENKEKAELLVLRHIPKEEWSQREQEYQNNHQSYILLGENDKKMLVAEIKQKNNRLVKGEQSWYVEGLMTSGPSTANWWASNNRQEKEISTDDLTEKSIITSDRYESTDYPLIAELPKEDIYLYGLKPNGVVLKYSDKIQIFNWEYTTPRFILPVLNTSDLDHDGNDEIICILNVGSGTGVSLYEFHVLKPNGTSGYDDYIFSDYLEQMKAMLSMAYDKKKNSIILKINNNSYIYDIPAEYQKLTYENIAYGDIVYFDSSHGLKIKIPLGVLFKEFASPQFFEEDAFFEGDIVLKDGNFQITNPQITDN